MRLLACCWAPPACAACSATPLPAVLVELLPAPTIAPSSLTQGALAHPPNPSLAATQQEGGALHGSSADGGGCGARLAAGLSVDLLDK